MLHRRPSPARSIVTRWARALTVAATLGASSFVARDAAAADHCSLPTAVTIPTATADALAGQGQGLCVASAISMNAASDFPAAGDTGGEDTFRNAVTTFIDANKANWNQYVQRTIFDLSNNQDTGPKISWGDFTDSMSPQCQTGGCDFPWNDTTTAFGSRFRGFLNVPATIAGKPVHIGVYADDAVALTFYDKDHNAYPILTRPPEVGLPTWRITNTVTFAQPGLYPLEILYAEIAEHAALEMSFFTGTFADFQCPANIASVPPDPPNDSLNTSGFTLYKAADFFQTLSGSPSYPDLDQCKQCDRSNIGQFGNNGCDSGYYCNEAALCAPCDTAIFCGPTCSPCGGMTPFCINSNGKLACGECRSDLDCKTGFSCDPTTHVCNQCNVDADCPVRGQECVQHVCQWCSSPDKCAGNSCNCCPKGSNGRQMQCTVLPGDQTSVDTGDAGADGGASTLGPPPECVECLSDADCAGSSNGTTCDLLTGQCVQSHATNESPDCCGPGCLKCEASSVGCFIDGTACTPGLDQCCSGRCVTRILPGQDTPTSTCQPYLCLPGPYGTACAECRNDTECPDSTFCIQGKCSACTTDRHCGNRCETCGGDTPFCLSTQVAGGAACVRCNTDDECDGGQCDATTHACTTSCMMTCAPATPFCDGKSCVECYADTQCPCGNTCDLDTHTCDTSCKTNADCQGDQHCHYAPDGASKACSPGPLPDNADCGGTLADLCGNSIGARGQTPTPGAGVLALSLAALLARRYRRKGNGR